MSSEHRYEMDVGIDCFPHLEGERRETKENLLVLPKAIIITRQTEGSSQRNG